MQGQLAEIRLYMFLRLLMLFSVLASAVLYQRSGALTDEVISTTYLITFCTFLLTTVFIFLYEKIGEIRYFLASQAAYDVLFTTALIFYTLPYETIFTVFYFFNILFTALLFRSRGALVAALASGGLYVFVTWVHLGSFSGEKFFSTLTLLTALIAIALLGGQLFEELRRSRQKITRLEQLSEEIVDFLDSGLIALDARGVIQKVNRTAVGMMSGGDVVDFLGLRIEEVFPAIEGLQGSRVHDLKLGGMEHRILVTRVSLPDQQSLILLRDLSEILDLEEKMRRQERLAGIGRLAAGVAHEIRNPIASISGAAQLLTAGHEDEKEQERLLTIIGRESERVDRLVAQLLRFARPNIVERKPVQLASIVRDSVESVRARPDFQPLGIDITVDVTEDLVVQGSADQLSEVVSNLLVNAMQAFESAQADAPRKLRIEARRVNGHIELIVADNGPGIPREFRGRIFDPFFTTKPYGTGLGLAQVHKIVREHEGSVDVESEEGKGTALKIRLPG